MKKSLIALAVILSFSLFFISLSAFSVFAESKKPIRLNFVSFFPLANKVEYQHFKREFIDKVNERAKGKLFIKVRGGPEVIPPFNLGVSVQKGVIDMATIPTAFFESLVPGADSTKLSAYTAQEERKNGIYEYIRDMYKKGGLYYLGRGEATVPGFFYLFINKRIQKPEDFSGLKFGGSTAFHGFYRRLGGSVTTLSIMEYHSAMERGVVDGIGTSIFAGLQFGLPEVSKYLISHSFYRSTVALPVNLGTWNRIPKHLQDMMTETLIEFGKKHEPFDAEQRKLAEKKMEKAGVKILSLSPKAAKWFIEAAREGSWEYAKKRFPGDVIPKLRDRITK